MATIRIGTSGWSNPRWRGPFYLPSLRRIGLWCREWQAKGLDVFCYFDNDAGGHAPRDALALRQLVNGRT